MDSSRKYKLIASDLDETLLDKESDVTPYTLGVFRRVAGLGVKIVLATGRPVESALPYHRLCGLDTPLISFNGAVVSLAGSSGIKTVRETTLPAASANDAIDLARALGIHFQLYPDDRLLYERTGAETRYYENRSGMRGEVADFDAVRGLRFRKGLFLSLDDGERLFPEIRRRLGKRLEACGARLVQSSPFYLELLPADATKGRALEFVAGHLGIGRTEIIAFGDAENDREMLEFAGRGVAMKGSVLAEGGGFEAAPFRHDENGVGRFLDALFF